MTNGQLNAVAAPTAQIAVAEQLVSTAASMDGMPQDGGAFAGLLSGIQSQAKVKAASDSGQSELLQVGSGKEQLERDVAVEAPSVDLLALIQGSSQITPASEPAAQQPVEPEKAEVLIDPVPLGSAALPAASQIVLAAYSQPGRMPEVNFSTRQTVDRQQNVAPVPEQSPVVAASPVENRVEQAAISTLPAETVSIASSGDELAASYSTQAEPPGRMPDVDKTPVPLPVDRLQDGGPEREKPTGLVKTASPSSQPVESDRMSVVSTLTALPGDNQHNGASEIIKPALLTSAPDRTRGAQPVADAAQVTATQTGVLFSEKKVSVTAAGSDLSSQGVTAVDAHVTLAGKTSQVSSGLEGEGMPVDQAAPALASSPETEVEIQLSQLRPITARATAVHVSADNRFAASAQETRAARQTSDPEQQQDVVKEMASSQQAGAASEEVTVSSDPSHSDDGNQGKPDSDSDTAMSVQDMRGQLKPEHQKVASFSTRQVSAEPVRENISEQVVQQVKERLGQHEVKPGNQQITLTLSPDSLGELKMNLNLQGQKLSVEIVTENKAVRDSIVQHADALKDSLGRQNITMESFDVTTGGKGSGNQGQNQNAWRELAKQQQQQFWTSTRGYAAAQADLPSGNVAYMKQPGNSMLDIHY